MCPTLPSQQKSLMYFIPELQDHIFIFIYQLHSIAICYHQVVDSPFLRYFSSFWVMKDEGKRLHRCGCLCFSAFWVFPVACTTAGHLSIIDLEDLEEIEISVVSCDVTPQTVGQANDSYPNTHPEPDPAQSAESSSTTRTGSSRPRFSARAQTGWAVCLGHRMSLRPIASQSEQSSLLLFHCVATE